MLRIRNGATASPISASVDCSAQMIENIAAIRTTEWTRGTTPSITRIDTHEGSPVTRAIVSPSGRRWWNSGESFWRCANRSPPSRSVMRWLTVVVTSELSIHASVPSRNRNTVVIAIQSIRPRLPSEPGRTFSTLWSQCGHGLLPTTLSTKSLIGHGSSSPIAVESPIVPSTPTSPRQWGRT